MTIFASEEPLVSIVIPAFNAESYIASAIRSGLAQTISRLEVIVIDDGSTDSTVTIVEREAALDRRVRLHRMERNSGVSAARNRGFALARGQWIAVLDSDDLMSPDRLERLVEEGDRHDADIVADNLTRFSSAAGPLTPVLSLTGDLTIDAKHYMQRNMFFRNSLHYGLLKPLFRTNAVRRSRQAYDEFLRIAEDDDFYLRLLLKGLRFRLIASAYYFYRQHPEAATKHLGAEDVALMTAASGRLLAEFPQHPLHNLILRRHRAFERASDYLQLIAALRGMNLMRALRIAARRPSSLPLLQTPLRSLLGNVLARADEPTEDAGLRRSLHEALRLAEDPRASVGIAGLEKPKHDAVSRRSTAAE